MDREKVKVKQVSLLTSTEKPWLGGLGQGRVQGNVQRAGLTPGGGPPSPLSSASSPESSVEQSSSKSQSKRMSHLNSHLKEAVPSDTVSAIRHCSDSATYDQGNRGPAGGGGGAGGALPFWNQTFTCNFLPPLPLPPPLSFLFEQNVFKRPLPPYGGGGRRSACDLAMPL